MADSLFDNRYRYNYIYPRGRSGETLRALDTGNGDRPVVIKRPAPNDAPPIRAGQEVSIINEREALTRLAGHPTLTELLGMGQTFVGGRPHQYIVMERAEGDIIADEVARLATANERLPELEMLEIIERLVDLLIAAHDCDIVYNDVDAKHLFWNRDNYTLKVIDWGNAVFLAGDEVTSGGISRQTDVYQVGELLYFILTGGRRADAPRDAPDDFQLDFGVDAATVNPRLQAIVSRAAHPNTRWRYTSLKALQADLSRYRSPLEQARNSAISRAIEKLKQPNLSLTELLSLRHQLDAAMKLNPAYPVGRATHSEVVDRLRDLEVAADLDAVRIFMKQGNWSRAAETLHDMRERAGSRTSSVVRLLLDWCMLLIDAGMNDAPAAIYESAAQIFAFKPDKAANILMRAVDSDDGRNLRWQLVERVTARFPDILLLRPNVLRLDSAVRGLGAEGIPVEELSQILDDINRVLDGTAKLDKPSAALLRDIYGDVVDNLSALNAKLQTLSLQHEFSERRLPLNALTRALNAAMALADNMHVIGKQAANNPRDALASLDASRAIDPPNPVWDQLEDQLSHLYEILKTSQTFVPAVDGSDLARWLKAKHEELVPFAVDLFDEMLLNILDMIQVADSAWLRYREVIVAGNKIDALNKLETASRAVGTISPTLSSWFDQLAATIEAAPYVERHSVPGHLGRTLADGWAAFDQGQLADAERLGQQAREITRSDNEQYIAERLYKLSRLLREWVERNGAESKSRTEKTLLDIERLFRAAESRAIDKFASQMPSTETYLKAMGQGLVAAFGDSNTASLRILFAQYVLYGVLDAHEHMLEDARFWRDAASRALPDAVDRHPAMRILDDYIARRSALLGAQDTLNGVCDRDSLARIDDIVGELEGNAQARLLAPAINSLRSLEAAAQDWASAEFRAAGNKIEAALRAITETEANAGLTLEAYREWLTELLAAAAELSVKRRSMLGDIDRQADEPQASIRDAIHLQADLTDELLGTSNAQTMLGWRNTYEQFLDIYQSDLRRSQKLEDMDSLFKALFIERNPAYPLFRHWYRLVESAPEEPVSQAEATPETPELEALPPAVEDLPAPEEPVALVVEAPRRALSKPLFALAALVGIVLIVGGLMTLAADGSFDQILASIGLNATETPMPATPPATVEVAETGQSEDAAIAAPALTATDAPTATQPPTAMPSATPTPLPSATPTIEPSATAVPAPTLPAEGLTGAQNLLTLLAKAGDAPNWSADQLALADGAWRFGAAGEGAGGTLALSLPPELFEDAYGNDAARRIRRVEADLTLQSYNPAVVSDDVYFGILLQSVANSDNAGIQAQAVEANIIQLALYRDDEANFISQRPVNALIARLRLDRDPDSGAVQAYYNDSPVGEQIPFLGPEAAALPYIFVRDGGVVIGISSWSVTLD